jgi:DNA-binding MurR/RpiR family transcriptional regulator
MEKTIENVKLEHNENVLIRMQNYKKALTKSEKKVADVVLSETEKIIYYSITELAEIAGVGEATIIRFSRKIGFKSYQDLKLALAKDLAKQAINHTEETTEDDNPIAIAQKLTAMKTQVLKDSLAVLEQNSLEQAINFILKAKKIHFYGVGTSGMAAIYSKYQFQRIGMLVDAYNEAHFQAVAATTLEQGDVAIGISLSGSTTDTVQTLEIAKNEGATIICITHHARSPITKIADVVLFTSIEEGPIERGASASFMSQLHIIDILLTGVGMKMKEKAEKFKEKTAKAVMDKIF